MIEGLGELGLVFNQGAFLQELETSRSAQQIATRWTKTLEKKPQGQERDFLSLAIWVLWERLGPVNNLPMERLERFADEGQLKVVTNDPVAGCQLWLRVWDVIKYKIKGRSLTLDDLSQWSDSFFVSNVCQDLMWELHNAGLKTPVYFHKRIDYCREFLELFPHEDKETVHNMRRAIAETYASLGDHDRAEIEFEQLVQDFPHNPWGYIGWGDVLRRRRKDLTQAKELYSKALSVAKEKFDREAALERLEDLEGALEQGK